jgi:hypothetical protein
MKGLINKGDMFQFARWLNLLIGLYNLFLFTIGGSYLLLGIGSLNIGVWVFSRLKG